jgi:hypothetical protein
MFFKNFLLEDVNLFVVCALLFSCLAEFHVVIFEETLG